jgi:hypothetical protein
MNMPKATTMIRTAIISAFAYALTFGVMAGFDQAEAGTRQIASSDCHAALDSVGATLNNSGVLSNSSATTVAVYCPLVTDSIIGGFNSTDMFVYGNEAAGGSTSNSRACMCLLNPIACSCSNQTNWSNNVGGISGRVADVDTQVWVSAPEQKFKYMLHNVTQSSALAGVILVSP